jgi:beta-aspartyl-dipeptidase (metallo-type)
MLGLATENTARVLKLSGKGRLEKDRDSDVLIMRRGSLEIVHVLARGRFMVDDGRLMVEENFARTTNRTIHVEGTKGSDR